ncbi:MAG: hypothetical protein LBE92_22050 [Chryseobacterium sp.]|jgi:hypothetical protein|uniref:hypothetical protein n=1 Tax=Chryseobacterium sp. TaxID=1871047 RepID=UPI0028186EC1|nr:hypothetical protein [Chryseobacterium sp.]MDR2238807.1 hypothetical protein [Chryseobacterium sp.]
MKNNLFISLLSTLFFFPVYGQVKKKIKSQPATHKIQQIKKNEIENITRNFSCTINGKLFNPTWETFASEPKNAGITITQNDSQTYVLLMGLEMKPNYVESITIGGINFNKTGRYPLNRHRILAEYSYRSSTSKPAIHISSKDEETFSKGELILTKFDTIHKRFKGEFNFVLFNGTVSQDTIKVTHGNFYLNLEANYKD